MSKRRAAVFPHQGEKLAYLIDERRDQRTADPKNQNIVLDEWVTLADEAYPSPIVTNQASLARAIGIDRSHVSRWVADRQRIPNRALREICRIFRIDEDAFRELSLNDFKAACQAPASKPQTPGEWRHILQHAALDTGLVLLRDPFGIKAANIRYARLPREGDPERSMPNVVASDPFWMEFPSPRRPNGRPLWDGWRVLLFNHDIQQQGFKCLLPASSHPAFVVAAFPSKERLILPRAPILWHEAGDLGLFEMVLVASLDVFPADIVKELSGGEAQGFAIEPALDRLAAFLRPQLERSAAGICRARYRVIEKKVGKACT